MSVGTGWGPTAWWRLVRQGRSRRLATRLRRVTVADRIGFFRARYRGPSR